MRTWRFKCCEVYGYGWLKENSIVVSIIDSPSIVVNWRREVLLRSQIINVLEVFRKFHWNSVSLLVKELFWQSKNFNVPEDTFTTEHVVDDGIPTVHDVRQITRLYAFGLRLYGHVDSLLVRTVSLLFSSDSVSDLQSLEGNSILIHTWIVYSFPHFSLTEINCLRYFGSSTVVSPVLSHSCLTCSGRNSVRVCPGQTSKPHTRRKTWKVGTRLLAPSVQ